MSPAAGTPTALDTCLRRLATCVDPKAAPADDAAAFATAWSDLVGSFAQVASPEQRRVALGLTVGQFDRLVGRPSRQLAFLRAGFDQLALAWPRLPGGAAGRSRCSQLLELTVRCSFDWLCCCRRKKPRRQRNVDTARRLRRLREIWLGGILLAPAPSSSAAAGACQLLLELQTDLVTLLHEYVGRYAYVSGLHPGFAGFFVRLLASLAPNSPLARHTVECVFEHYYCQYYPLVAIRGELASGHPARLVGADAVTALTGHRFLVHCVNYRRLLRHLLGCARLPGATAAGRRLLLRLAAMAACVLTDRPPHANWASVTAAELRQLADQADEGDKEVEEEEELNEGDPAAVNDENNGDDDEVVAEEADANSASGAGVDLDSSDDLEVDGPTKPSVPAAASKAAGSSPRLLITSKIKAHCKASLLNFTAKSSSAAAPAHSEEDNNGAKAKKRKKDKTNRDRAAAEGDDNCEKGQQKKKKKQQPDD